MNLQLQFVGCGDAFGSGGRFNTCFHLTGANTNLLIDCGATSVVAMKRLGIDRNAIGVIAITHFHADHFGGIPFFMLDAQFFSKRREPLVIVGPPGLAQWYERVMETGFPGASAAARKFALELRELAAGEVVDVAGVRIAAHQALHGPPGGPYHCLRVEAEGKAIAYSGDTEWCDGLVGAARDADMLIAEAYFGDRRVATHLGLVDILEHRAEITSRRIVLTHMSDDMLTRAVPPGFEVAEDGLILRID